MRWSKPFRPDVCSVFAGCPGTGRQNAVLMSFRLAGLRYSCVADAVGDQVEVLLDGGIRRGSDVVKALSLGARAVMIGRAYLWGMAASGERGVTNVLEILRQGTSETLYGLGKSSLSPDDVIVPDGFTADRKL